MEIRVQRSEFLGELAPMQGIVERRTTIPVLSHILLPGRRETCISRPPIWTSR